jgi:hypothetical protein
LPGADIGAAWIEITPPSQIMGSRAPMEKTPEQMGSRAPIETHITVASSSSSGAYLAPTAKLMPGPTSPRPKATAPQTFPESLAPPRTPGSAPRPPIQPTAAAKCNLMGINAQSAAV